MGQKVITKIKKIIKDILFLFPPQVIRGLYYFITHGVRINWKNPQSFDEKISRIIVDMKGKDYTKYVDKLTVYDYVRQCGLEELLIPILGVYDDPLDIKYDDLPSKFIIKTTHGCGSEFYVICTDKEKFDIEAATIKLKAAMKRNYAKDNFEYQYDNLQPRIMIQKLLEKEGQKRVSDYKIYCVDGNPKWILVCTSRDEGMDTYSIDWEYRDYMKEEIRSGKIEPKPECLPQMLEAAKILSAPFSIARIDFYIAENTFWFGEITLTPSGGNSTFCLNQKGQMELGKLLK